MQTELKQFKLSIESVELFRGLLENKTEGGEPPVSDASVAFAISLLHCLDWNSQMLEEPLKR